MRPIQYAIFKCAGMQRCISRTGQRFLAAGGPAPAHTSASRRGVSKPSHNRRSNEGNIHEPNAAIMSTAVGNIENKSKKRVALVVGYVGTRYHGLQDNKNPSWPTIEQHLEEALYQAGYIATSNHKDISKIGWSRSSRTDKGVHAARVIISAKLLLEPSLITDDRIPSVVEETNKQLPEDIRVFSCYRVSNGFKARRLVNWREYEYVLPIEYLRSSYQPLTENADGYHAKFSNPLGDTNNKSFDYLDWNTMSNIYLQPAQQQMTHETDEVLVARLSEQLKLFVGINSCHNFSNEKTKSDHLFGNESKLQLRQELWEKHKLSKSRSADGLGKDISGREDTCGFAEASLKDEDDNDRDDDTDHDEDVVEEIAEMASSKAAYSFHIYNPNEFIDQRLNIAKEFNSAIYAFNLHETNQAGFKDNNLLRIRVKGQAFMLNQIRLMIGASIAVVRGLMPSDMINIALLSKTKLRLPMVPAEGLCLIQNGFDRNCDGSFFALQAIDEAEKSIMTPTEYEASEKFYKQYILPQIIRDTLLGQQCMEENGIIKSVVDDWVVQSERFRVPRALGETWLTELAKSRVELEEINKIKSIKGVIRIESLLSICNEMIQSGIFIGRKVHGKQKIDFWKCKTLITTAVTELEDDDLPRSTVLPKLVAAYGLINAVHPKKEERRCLSVADATAELCCIIDGSLPLAKKMLKASASVMRLMDPPIAISRDSAWSIPYQFALPNQINTELIIRFNLSPGALVIDLQRAIAIQVLRGELPASFTAKEIVDDIERQYMSKSSSKIDPTLWLRNYCRTVENVPWVA